MPGVERRYPKEEFARRGDAIYERVVAPRLSGRDKGKFVAIDIESGEYEIDKDELRGVRAPRGQTETFYFQSRESRPDPE